MRTYAGACPVGGLSQTHHDEAPEGTARLPLKSPARVCVGQAPRGRLAPRWEGAGHARLARVKGTVGGTSRAGSDPVGRVRGGSRGVPCGDQRASATGPRRPFEPLALPVVHRVGEVDLAVGQRVPAVGRLEAGGFPLVIRSVSVWP